MKKEYIFQIIDEYGPIPFRDIFSVFEQHMTAESIYNSIKSLMDEGRVACVASGRSPWDKYYKTTAI